MRRVRAQRAMVHMRAKTGPEVEVSEVVMEEGLGQFSQSEKSTSRWRLPSYRKSSLGSEEVSKPWIRSAPGRRTTYLLSAVIGIATIAVMYTKLCPILLTFLTKKL